MVSSKGPGTFSHILEAAAAAGAGMPVDATATEAAAAAEAVWDTKDLRSGPSAAIWRAVADAVFETDSGAKADEAPSAARKIAAERESFVMVQWSGRLSEQCGGFAGL